MFEPEPSAKPAVKTVLVVEDDQDFGEVVVLALSQETSYIPFLATDGEQALAFMQDIEPDLVVVDYYLPDMNGIELYDHWHTSKHLKDVPAIMVSAALPARDLQERGLLGLAKPLDLDELLETTTSLLRSTDKAR